MRRTFAALALACCAASCATAPPAPVSRTPPGPPFEQKLSWILRLEDERSLGDPVPPAPPPPPVVKGQKPPVVEPPPPVPNLVRLLADSDARIRRRAALAIGRVGLSEGVAPLVALLKDGDPEVRQMAAFALGLIGDKSARDPLIAALSDPQPVVKGSAAEALGLLGDASAADAIARMASTVTSGATLPEDAPSAAPVMRNDDDERRDTPAAAWRLAIYALARLKAYPALASVALDPAGHVRAGASANWQLAYALGRTEDPRAATALMELAKSPHPYTRAFAAKGLGAVKAVGAVPVLLPLVDAPEPAVRIEAIRALGKIGDRAASARLLTLIRDPKTDATLRVEALAAIGTVGGEGVLDTLFDMLADRNPRVRAATMTSLATLDRDSFVTALSSLEPDTDWRVRSAVAAALGTLPADMAMDRLKTMLGDSDQRVIPFVIGALAAIHPPEAAQIVLDHLKADDLAVRAAAAEAVGRLKPQGGDAALTQAYQLGQRDPDYTARAAALGALSEYGAAAAVPVLNTALADKDWAVRLRAATLLKKLDPSSDAAARIRPAPTAHPAEFYDARTLTTPPVSTILYIDTDRGTIQIELAVLDAPMTIASFVALAQKDFFNGISFHRVVPDFVVQAGDPRGDGEGGPGFTLRDELSERSFLRGTVGIALDGPDTGGSQFFITHSPQPHLDARYTIIGHVVSGMEIVDAIQQGDVIRRVRVWNGE